MRDGRTRKVTGTAKPSGAAAFLAKHRVTLVVVDGGAAGTEYELDRPRTIVGRGPAVDIAIDDATMSRQHAAVEIAADGVHARDLGSTNGIRVNGEPVAAASLAHGDSLELGGQKLRLILEERRREPRTYVVDVD
jgi:pSer/pThr/pTyr-binding forkhead associated (FHA) protein